VANGVVQKEFCVQQYQFEADLKFQDNSGQYKKIPPMASTGFELLMNLVGP
jgi:hypothetical protein